MDDLEFEWDEANVRHIARHRVTPAEVEQVFKNGVVEIDFQLHEGEERTVCLGHANSGRLLTVAYTMRRGTIRVAAAFPMSQGFRRVYEAKKRIEGEYIREGKSPDDSRF